MNAALDYKTLHQQLISNNMSINSVVEKLTHETKLVSTKVLPKQQKRIDPD